MSRFPRKQYDNKADSSRVTTQGQLCARCSLAGKYLDAETNWVLCWGCFDALLDWRAQAPDCVDCPGSPAVIIEDETGRALCYECVKK